MIKENYAFLQPVIFSPQYLPVVLLLLFNLSVVSNSLRPYGLQHARLSCPSPSPGVCSNACPLSQWWHPTISSSVDLFSSYLQSFPASQSFPMSWLFTSGGQSIGALAPVLPMNILGWFPLGLTGLIPLLFKGLSRVISSTLVRKHHFFWCSACFTVQLSYLYMPTGKTIALTIQTFVRKVMFLLFNILAMFVIAFLPRSKCLLISWLQSPFTVILEPEKMKSVTVSPLSAMKWCHDLRFLNAEA